MKKITLAIVALFAFALPAFGQTNQEMFMALERLDRLEASMATTKQAVIQTKAELAATQADVATIKADVSTMKMNTNAMAAKVDSIDSKVEKLLRAPVNASASSWTEAPASSSWGSSDSSAAGWSSSPMMSRPRLMRPLLRRGSSSGCSGGS